MRFYYCFLRKLIRHTPRFCQSKLSTVAPSQPPWKVIFFGTDDFAVESLKMLFTELQCQRLVSDLSVVCAQSRCSVAKFVATNNLKLIQWKPSIESIIKTGSHVGLVASFGHLISSQIISAFPLGMLNVHASLLPRWRGAAPIVHAILHKDQRTGVSIMRIRPHRFDEGEVLRSAACDIERNETAVSLTHRLSLLGAEELRHCLADLPGSLASSKPQSTEGITYAPKVNSSMTECHWQTMKADEVYARHLALGHLHPLQTTWQSYAIRLLECVLIDEKKDGDAGEVAFDWGRKQLTVTCQDNSVLHVGKVKLPGKPNISAVDFLNGYLKKVPKHLWRFES